MPGIQAVGKELCHFYDKADQEKELEKFLIQLVKVEEHMVMIPTLHWKRIRERAFGSCLNAMLATAAAGST